MLEQSIENITKSDSRFAPAFVDYHVLVDITFNGRCLINNIYITKESNKYIFISYTLSPQLRNVNTGFTLKNKNADPDKYEYSSHGIGFDSRSEFLFTD